MKRTIKGLRFDIGMTQKEMAEKLGYPIETFKKYERYEVKIPAKFLIELADLCKVDDIRSIKIN